MQTRTVDAGLRSLAHPITWAAIALLLANDHIFKSLAPSWLTGKLSDFAGLFFFPLFVATLLGLLATPFRNASRLPLAQTAFVLTAVWFTAIKTLPAATQQTQQLVSLLLGRSAVIVLDPTDIIALVSLWPAWRLWSYVEAHPGISYLPPRVRWLMLTIAAVATMATSPAPPPEMVQRIIIAGSRVGAITSCYRGNCNDWMAYESVDGGRTWSELWKFEGQALEQLKASPVQQTATDPTNPNRMYRVVAGVSERADGRVEKSEDGGQTWNTAWRVPAGRDEFMLRYHGIFAGKSIQMGPFELGFIPDGSGALLVALGNEGILRKDPQGDWTRHPVGSAQPTPYRTFNPGQWFSILLPDGLAALLVVVLGGLLLSPFGWFPLFLPSATVKRLGNRGLFLPAATVTAALVAIGLLVVRTPNLQGSHPLTYALEWLMYYNAPWLMAGAFIALSLTVLLWALGIRRAKNSRLATDAQLGCFGAVIRMGLVAILPLILWVIGVIPWYQAALGIGAFLVLLTFGHGGVNMYHRASRAVDSEQ